MQLPKKQKEKVFRSRIQHLSPLKILISEKWSPRLIWKVRTLIKIKTLRSKISIFKKEDSHLDICGKEEKIKTTVCRGGTRKTLRITGLTNKVLAILYYIAAMLFQTESAY